MTRDRASLREAGGVLRAAHEHLVGDAEVVGALLAVPDNAVERDCDHLASLPAFRFSRQAFLCSGV